MLYAGVVAAAVWNANPFGGEDRKAMSPLDFVPDLPRPEPTGITQSLDDQIKILTEVMRCGPGRVN